MSFMMFSAEIACDSDTSSTAESTNRGVKAKIVASIIELPGVVCVTHHCYQKSITNLKRRIQSTLSAAIVQLTVRALDGTRFSISSRFCEFGQTVAGKRVWRVNLIVRSNLLIGKK